MQSHHCHCSACRARDDRHFADVVACSYSARTLARLVKLAAPMETAAPVAPAMPRRGAPASAWLDYVEGSEPAEPAAPEAESVRPAIRAMLETIRRAETCARTAGDNALADSLYALGCALAHAEDSRNQDGGTDNAS